jgi:hypothetical protein
MDRTAIASVIVGFGATIAAMVFPTKYPNAPSWAINGVWYIGLGLIVLGAGYLITEHPLSSLLDVILATLLWFWAEIVAIQRLPGFWIGAAFLCGIAAHKWLIPRIKNYFSSQPIWPTVEAWLTPREALQTFVHPEYLWRLSYAEKRSGECLARLQDCERRFQMAEESARNGLTQELAAARNENSMAEYVTNHARADVFGNLYNQLSDGHLVAKGNEVKGDKLRNRETVIPAHFWKLRVAGMELLNVERGSTDNIFGRYENVMIGKTDKPLSGALIQTITFPDVKPS